VLHVARKAVQTCSFRSASHGRPEGLHYDVRFTGENLEHNLNIVESLRRIAVEKGATVAQLAIAWVLARGADIVPLVGARRRDRLTDAMGAVDLRLTPDDLARLEAAVPANAAAGTRYDARQMQMLDSERKSTR
jgi:aryl-alcohol dehydrogenase-like predicted oxidoreductase